MPQSKKKLSSKKQLLIKKVSEINLAVKQSIATAAKKSSSVITGVPAWIRARPAAIKKWYREDRKKKKYRSFRLQKKIKPDVRYIPSTGALMKTSLSFIWQYKRVLFSILFIHVLVYVLIARSSQQIDIASLQESVKEAFGGNASSLSANIATLGAVLGVSGGAQTNAMITTIMTFGMSLVYVWAIRKLHASEAIKARDAYYQGLGPVIPVLFLLIVLSVQLLPFAISSFVYTTARTGGIFANGIEDLSLFVFTVFCALLSLYLMTSTIIALYIVTLPGMRPVHALRAAKKLVQFQRFNVFKRIVSFPIVLALGYLLVLFLIVRFTPSNALLFTEAFPIIILPFVHTYLYKLYRSLI